VLRLQPLSLNKIIVFKKEMGGSEGFNKLIRNNNLIKPILPNSLTNQHTLLVDVSYLIHYLHCTECDLAVEVFKIGNGFEWLPLAEENLDSLVGRYANSIHRLLAQGILTPAKKILYFEDQSPKSDRRAEKMSAKKASKLNEACRGYFLSHVPVKKSVGQKMIATNMGRPPWWFVTRVALVLLKEHKYNIISAPTRTQADEMIIRSAPEKSFVLASDRDFICMSRKDTIQGIITINRFHGIQIIFRQDVLKVLKCTSDDLLWSYCSGGIDDIITKLPGIGFPTAFKILRGNTKTINESAFIKLFGLDKKLLHSLFLEISALKYKLSKKLDAQNQIPATVDDNRESMLSMFLNEKVSSDVHRRQQLRQHVLDRLDPKFVPPDYSSKQPFPHTKRLTCEKVNSERKSFPFEHSLDVDLPV